MRCRFKRTLLATLTSEPAQPEAALQLIEEFARGDAGLHGLALRISGRGVMQLPVAEQGEQRSRVRGLAQSRGEFGVAEQLGQL